MPVLIVLYIFLMNPYFGVSCVVLWLLALPFYRQLELKFSRLLSCGILALLLSSFQWLPRMLHSELHSPTRLALVKAFSADLSTWFLPTVQLWWLPESWTWWADLWSSTIPDLYLSWVVIGIVSLTFTQLPRKKYWFLLAGGVFLIMASGPSLIVFGREFLSDLLPLGLGIRIWPGLKALRVPSRFGYFVVLFLAIGLGKSLPARKLTGLAVIILLVLELGRPPLAARKLPSPQTFDRVRENIKAPALVPVPLTDWPTEVQYGQTIHRKKLAVSGLSYGIPPLWKRISRNPVLDAIYNYKPLPQIGWQELRREKFGGIIVHRKFFERVSGDILKQWLKTFRTKFGPPVISTSRIILFKFQKNS